MKRPLLAAALALASTVAFAAPLTYKIDANHTDVVASWSHFGFSNPIAHFGKVDGNITYDPANVGASKVEVTIPLSGLDSHVPDFDAHLRSADFFDAEKFPSITFKSTSVKAAGKGKLKVTGDLTIKGVTKPVTLTVTEFLILLSLAQRPGVVKSRDALMDAAYDEQVYVDDRTIDSHIKRLRKKFKVVDDDFDMIETLYGVGYRFREA